MKNEIKSLTGIRGIAASWVVLLHFFYVLKLVTDNVFFDGVNQFLLKGNMGVDMFFLLSAFVMSLAYQNTFSEEVSGKGYLSFFKKRLIRIYPAYLFWLILFTLSFGNFNIPVFLSNALLIQNFFDPDKFLINGVFWSLSTEWVMYMIFPFFILLFEKLHRMKKHHLILGLIICISFVGIYLLPHFDIYYICGVKTSDHTHNIFTGLNSYIRCLFDYIVGISIFYLSRKGDLFTKLFGNKKRLPMFIFAGILILSFFRQTELVIIAGFALLILALYFNSESQSFFNCKFVYFLGLISYSMYLLHPLLRFLITVFAMKLFHLPVEAVNLPCTLVAFALTIPVSYLSYKYIEKKGGDMLRKWLGNNNQVAVLKN